MDLWNSLSFQIRQIATFTLVNFSYRVDNSVVGAMMEFIARCPATREDWKLEILFANDEPSKSIDFSLCLGHNANAELITKQNIFNDLAMSLDNTTLNYRYKYTSAVFTLNKGDNVQGSLYKTNDNGTGQLRIFSIDLIY